MIFGPNMTSLDFTLSRTAGRDFAPGDEILVSSLDHDGGVAPWLELARDRGLVVRHVELHEDTTLDFADLEAKLGPRTRVVAFAWASNAVGTIVDARRVCELAHQAGALAWIDAVHYAAHEPINVREVGADVLICSPYKFCGPHLGLAYGRAEVIERWRPYKARPAPGSPLGRRFETGTQPYELLAGFSAAIDYLDSIGGFAAIVALRAGARRAIPGQHPRRGHRVRAAGDGRAGCRRSWSTSTACPRRTWPSGWPPPRSGSGRTTRGTRSTCTSGSATTTSPCGSASSTTTPPTRSTGSSQALADAPPPVVRHAVVSTR